MKKKTTNFSIFTGKNDKAVNEANLQNFDASREKSSRVLQI